MSRRGHFIHPPPLLKSPEYGVTVGKVRKYQEEKNRGLVRGTGLLGIDSESTLVYEVISIEHDPTSQAVTVSFGMARGLKPVIRGRLSGPALMILTWTIIEDVAYGVYEMLKSGVYYLEIVALFCNQLDRALQAKEIANSCVENVRWHRITSKNAYINIPAGSQTAGIGSWAAKDHFDQPLYTRVQPSQCKNNKKNKVFKQKRKFCDNLVSTERFKAIQI